MFNIFGTSPQVAPNQEATIDKKNDFLNIILGMIIKFNKGLSTTDHDHDQDHDQVQDHIKVSNNIIKNDIVYLSKKLKEKNIYIKYSDLIILYTKYSDLLIEVYTDIKTQLDNNDSSYRTNYNVPAEQQQQE